MALTIMQPKLIEWQQEILPVLLKMDRIPSPQLDNVTVLSYFFWDDDRIYTEFNRFKCAFLCTFKILGQLPAVLVVNRTTTEMISFCKSYGIQIQVEESLTGAGLPAMSLDCISKLYRRFETEYVLIIQNDGFPLNHGLESFIGRYDYVGAPWPGHTSYKDLFPYPKYGVGNGGFSLRSKQICQRAAHVYHRHLRHIPYNWLFTDDVFYCKTMRFFSPCWRQEFRFPLVKDAAIFSIECLTHFLPDAQHPPIGFHSAYGFQQYVKHYGMPFPDLIQARC